MTEERGAILIVDDEETVRNLLGRTLEEVGYSVVTATNGLEALEQVSLLEVDVVLLDIKMPGLDGFQVLEGTRQRSNVVTTFRTPRGSCLIWILTIHMGTNTISTSLIIFICELLNLSRK